MFIESNNEMAKIAINKSLLKEYKTNSDPRVVYMNNGDEFQIQLFNPESDTIGAEVSINGKTIPGILVIRPGERIWLERYLTENAKFKFTTYEVDDPDDDSSVARAIANNGTIEIKFYREKPNNRIDNPVITWTSKSSDINWASKSSDITTLLNDFDYQNKVTTKRINADNILSNDITKLNCCADSVINNVLYSSSDDINTTVTNCALPTETNLRSKSIASVSDTKIALDIETPYNSTNKIETGRIDKGSYSNQLIEHVNIDFATWHFKREVIKILPTSRKPYTSSDIQKIYCTNCGRKLNTKYKFCPYCGEKCVQF